MIRFLFILSMTFSALMAWPMMDSVDTVVGDVWEDGVIVDSPPKPVTPKPGQKLRTLPLYSSNSSQSTQNSPTRSEKSVCSTQASNTPDEIDDLFHKATQALEEMTLHTELAAQTTNAENSSLAKTYTRIAEYLKYAAYCWNQQAKALQEENQPLATVFSEAARNWEEASFYQKEHLKALQQEDQPLATALNNLASTLKATAYTWQKETEALKSKNQPLAKMWEDVARRFEKIIPSKKLAIENRDTSNPAITKFEKEIAHSLEQAATYKFQQVEALQRENLFIADFYEEISTVWENITKYRRLLEEATQGGNTPLATIYQNITTAFQITAALKKKQAKELASKQPSPTKAPSLNSNSHSINIPPLPPDPFSQSSPNPPLYHRYEEEIDSLNNAAYCWHQKAEAIKKSSETLAVAWGNAAQAWSTRATYQTEQLTALEQNNTVLASALEDAVDICKNIAKYKRKVAETVAIEDEYTSQYWGEIASIWEYSAIYTNLQIRALQEDNLSQATAYQEIAQHAKDAAYLREEATGTPLISLYDPTKRQLLVMAGLYEQLAALEQEALETTDTSQLETLAGKRKEI